jgi:hypothetical protein
MSMKARVRGKRVAIVGRAGSILGRGQGKEIDAADVVVRVNWILPVPGDQVADVGSRTDLLYTCVNCEEARRVADEHGVPWVRVKSKRRSKVTDRYFPNPEGLRCTTGFLAVADVADAGARLVHVYGFDLFRSGHVQERWPDKSEAWKQDRMASNPGPFHRPASGWQHNEGEEAKAWVRLLLRHRTIRPDALLQEAIPWPA